MLPYQDTIKYHKTLCRSIQKMFTYGHFVCVFWPIYKRMCSVVADCLQKQHNKETKSYKVGTWMLMKEFLETNQTQKTNKTLYMQKL